MKVTTALKEVVKNVRPEYSRAHVRIYSDTRKPGGIPAVGVKMVDLFLNEKETAQVREQMEQMGFTYQYIRRNTGSFENYYDGTRFCFSPQNIK